MTLLALPTQSSPERIGLIDYSDWVENTDFGLPADEPTGIWWNDLVYQDELGPFTRAIWLGSCPGWTLPIVRGRFTTDDRAWWRSGDAQIRVAVQTWGGKQVFLVDPLPRSEEYRALEGAREAFRRVLRVLVRREHGLHTSYITDSARFAGTATR